MTIGEPVIQIGNEMGDDIEVDADSLEGVDLSGSDLHRVLLNLSGARLVAAVLRNACLDDADLRSGRDRPQVLGAEFSGERSGER